MVLELLVGRQEKAAAQRRSLPWLAAIHQADALWISGDEAHFVESDVAELTGEMDRLRMGFDVLLGRSTPASLSGDAALKLLHKLEHDGLDRLWGRAHNVALLNRALQLVEDLRNLLQVLAGAVELERVDTLDNSRPEARAPPDG